MKLTTISSPTNLSNTPSGVDLDVASNVAPSIGKHIASLETLIALLPNSDEICEKLGELKNLLASILQSSSPVIEDKDLAPTILDYDANKSIAQQRAHIHGVGTSSVGFLPTKIIREAGFVDDEIKEIDDLETKGASKQDLLNKYKVLAHRSEQMARSATTLRNGIRELMVKKQLGNIFPNTKIDEQVIHVSVQKLEDRLREMVKTGASLSYDSIDNAMQQICKEDGCSPGDLHDLFKSSHEGMTPDEWAKTIKEQHIESTASIDKHIADSHVMEMFETMRIGLGDKAWVAISKRLRSEGYDPELVNRMIDRAIVLRS